jgi:hypothetical protein
LAKAAISVAAFRAFFGERVAAMAEEVGLDDLDFGTGLDEQEEEDPFNHDQDDGATPRGTSAASSALPAFVPDLGGYAFVLPDGVSVQVRLRLAAGIYKVRFGLLLLCYVMLIPGHAYV